MISLKNKLLGVAITCLLSVIALTAFGQSEDSTALQVAEDGTALDVEDGLYEISGFDQVTIKISRLPSSPAYRSTIGYYLAGALGRPIHGKIIWHDATEGVRTTLTINLNRWPEAKKLGFFLVPDGAARNQTLKDLDIVDLSLSRSQWVAFRDGTRLSGRNVPLYFTDPRLNPDWRPQAAFDAEANTLSWAERPVLEDPRFSSLKARLSVSASKQPPSLVVGERPRTDEIGELLAEKGSGQVEAVVPSVTLKPTELPPPQTQRAAPVADDADGDGARFAFDINDAESLTVELKPFPSVGKFGNSFGYYLKDETGRPYRGRVIWADTREAIGKILKIDRRALGKAKGIGFFVIPDGGNLNPHLRDGAFVGIAKYLEEWTVVLAGASLNGASLPAFFSEPQFNADGVDHVIDSQTPGNFNWEDGFRGGDNSFDDVNINVAVTVDHGAERSSEDLLTVLPDGPEAPVAAPITPALPSEREGTTSASETSSPDEPTESAPEADAPEVAEAKQKTDTAPTPPAQSVDPFWGEAVFSGFGEVELAAFPVDPQFDRQSDEVLQQSIAGSFEYAQDAGDRGETLIELFGRYDQVDDQRSYIDVQQAHVAYFGDIVSVRAGVLNETWGVLELENIVDIVNQRNIAEDFRADAKLGQPGIKLGFPFFSFGQADLYYLPYPRRRPFAGDEGRFQIAAIPVDDDEAFYRSAADGDAERWAEQGAARLQFLFGDLETAISHFYGTSRDPSFDIVLDGATPVALSPSYDQINQSGVELRAITLGNVLKAEAFRRTGEDPSEEDDAIYGVGAGIEREFVRIFDTDLALTLFGEYYYDSRSLLSDEVSPVSLDNDVFVGSRLAFNDLADTQVLLTSTVDVDTQATILALELQRRFGTQLQVNLKGEAFVDVDDDPGLTAFQDDHRIVLRARYYY